MDFDSAQFLAQFSTPQFWVALMQIVAIDIVLGGDNAVVIGLACRRLPAHQRKLGIFWGMVGAIGLRVVLIFFAVSLLAVPYLKIIGALLLLWIGVKLLLPELDDDGHNIQASDTLLAAIKTIIVADAVMSLDNVIAIAGAAGDSLFLVVFGLLLSVPIIIFGSQLVIKLMDRFPMVIVAGGALLGWIAGGMIVTDVIVEPMLGEAFGVAKWVGPLAGAIFVVVVGKTIAARRLAKHAQSKSVAAQ
jgi:YjbE family integral membrane protein